MLGHVRRRPGRFAAPSSSADDAPVTTVRPADQGRTQRLAIVAASLLALAIVGFAAVLGLALAWGGVYPGVRVAGVDLGGADRATAAARLAVAGATWEATTITLTGPAGASNLSRRDLGLRFDAEATLASAFAQGRDQSLVASLRTIVDLAFGGRELPVAYTVDEPALQAHLAQLAGATDIRPRDGALRIEGGRVVVIPAIEGRGLDIAGAIPLVLATAAPGGAHEVALPVAERLQPDLNAAVLAAAQARAETLLATPLTLRGDGLDRAFDAQAIGAWLTVRRVESDGATSLAIEIERAAVRRAVADLAPQVRRGTQSAAYEYDDRARAFVVSAPAVEGRQLDIEKTVGAVVATLDRPGERVVAPVADRWRPGLTSEDIAAASRKAARSYLAGPLTFTWEGQRWTLTPPELANWLTILPGLNPADGPRVVFDEAALTAYLTGLKGQIDQPAVDAGYTMDEGTDFYRVTSPSRVGRALDSGAALKSALAALSGKGTGRTLALPVGETKPRVSEADVAAMVPERWIDADLTTQTMRAMVGKRAIYTATISSGKKNWETPTGTFHIIYRVENETMTSESIGAEENYRLENVLYTQYFTDEGHALHYSWWKTPESFGTPTSHGCLSETLKDAEYFWNFATVGTRVTIRGVTPLR